MVRLSSAPRASTPAQKTGCEITGPVIRARAAAGTISVSGAYGGQTVDLRRLAAEGMTLLGLTQSYKDGVLTFAPDLAEKIQLGLG